MAEKGAQKGNKNASKTKDWEHTLRRVLTSFELKDAKGETTIKRGEALRKIAEQCVLQAIAGDKDARQEIANRLDGKPKEHVQIDQTVEHVLTYAEYLAGKTTVTTASADPDTTVQ
jgi:ribosomal protein L17